MKAEQKQAILEQEYGIKGDVEGGVSSMCNLSDLIVEETEARKLVEAVENIMESLEFSLQRACEVLKFTVEEYENAKRFLEKESQ